MSIKVTSKGSKRWVTELAQGPEMKSAIDEAGQRIAREANAEVNSQTNNQLPWHVRYFGKQLNNHYVGFAVTMTEQAAARPGSLMKG